MRVSVSTIMKDEPVGFVQRWAASAADADHRVLVDTGTSQTDAIECARDLGVTVHEIRVDPWRFDDARNAALALLPDCDAVVTLDVDEVLSPGWRDAMEAAGIAHRYVYTYIWSWQSDGTPDVVFQADRTHSRHGWRWKHPVHESLVWTGSPLELPPVPVEMTIEHHADDSKPRNSYLPLLKMAVEESPDDDRMAHYYARELFFKGHWAQARVEFMRHLALPTATWPAERAESYRYLAKMDDHPERWLLKAVAEDPGRREAWLELSMLHRHADPEVSRGFFRRAMSIRSRPLTYMTEEWAYRDDEQMEAMWR